MLFFLFYTLFCFVVPSQQIRFISSLSFRNTTKNLKLYQNQAFCGMDGTRTRDPLRDRQVF